LFVNLVTNDRLEEWLAGTPFDVGVLSDAQANIAVALLAHCALNGPVGVNKTTNFPGGHAGSIKTLLGQPNLSNRSWKTVCQAFSARLKANFADICNRCQQQRLHGDVWPLWNGA
jgi:hypothetical protein